MSSLQWRKRNRVRFEKIGSTKVVGVVVPGSNTKKLRVEVAKTAVEVEMDREEDRSEFQLTVCGLAEDSNYDLSVFSIGGRGEFKVDWINEVSSRVEWLMRKI